MLATEEVGEIRTLVVHNGSAFRKNYIGLQVYPVSKYESGEGLSQSPVELPNVDDKWSWKAGKSAAGLGTLKDRYLYLLKSFQAQKDGQKNAFSIKISVKKYFKYKYPRTNIN